MLFPTCRSADVLSLQNVRRDGHTRMPLCGTVCARRGDGRICKRHRADVGIGPYERTNQDPSSIFAGCAFGLLPVRRARIRACIGAENASFSDHPGFFEQDCSEHAVGDDAHIVPPYPYDAVSNVPQRGCIVSAKCPQNVMEPQCCFSAKAKRISPAYV